MVHRSFTKQVTLYLLRSLVLSVCIVGLGTKPRWNYEKLTIIMIHKSNMIQLLGKDGCMGLSVAMLDITATADPAYDNYNLRIKANQQS